MQKGKFDDVTLQYSAVNAQFDNTEAWEANNIDLDHELCESLHAMKTDSHVITSIASKNRHKGGNIQPHLTMSGVTQK